MLNRARVCVCVCVCVCVRARVRACVRALADGTNCVLENLRAGDAVHFFGCPRCLSSNGPGKNANCTTEDFVPPPLGTQAYVVAGSPEEMTDETLLADAAGLASNLTAEYSFTPFDASDIWRVRFVQPLPATVGRASLVNIDSFSTPGTVIRNNSFGYTKYNLGAAAWLLFAACRSHSAQSFLVCRSFQEQRRADSRQHIHPRERQPRNLSATSVF